MKKPVEAIERMRFNGMGGVDRSQILMYLDFIPEDAHVCKWPKWVTKELLVGFAQRSSWDFADLTSALRALAAIAPEKPKKRMVNIWEDSITKAVVLIPIGDIYEFPSGYWCKVGGPFEVDE